MTQPDAPKLESRRAAEFECELTERAEVWLPGWSRDEGAPDFGLALLKVAARFSSEVAERLDQTGDKMAKGFLDWLGFEAAAARPARVPVSFKLADTALEPVAAMHPIRLQAATGDEAVTFETETDLCLVPGKIAAVIGVDPGSDRYFLPPPGLTSLEPLEQLPNQWSLKSFAAAGSKTLQLDPGLGLAAGLIVEIAGGQYALNAAKDDLVTIDRKVPVGGFAAGTAVSKVADFRPFNGAINRQEHELYIGDSDLLNLDAAATIEVAGLPALGDDVTWQYWGKDEQNHPGGAVNWQSFDLPVQQSSGSVHLTKPKGAVEPLEVGAVQTRWIRARRDSSDQLVPADGVELRVNPLRPGRTEPDALGPQADWDKLLRPEVFVNTASVPPSSFYPLGREPRLFDTLYLGSAEAFSKPDATAWVRFDLADATLDAIECIKAFPIGEVLAGIDQSDTLNLFSVAADGSFRRFNQTQPLQPSQKDVPGSIGGDSGIALTSSGIPPVMWIETGLPSTLSVAVVAKDQVWVRTEVVPQIVPSLWEFRGTVPNSPGQTDPVTGLAVMRDASGKKVFVALRGGELYRCDETAWTPFGSLPGNEIAVGLTSVRPAISGHLPKYLLIVTKNPGVNPTYNVRSTGPSGPIILELSNIAGNVAPFGAENANGLNVAAILAAGKLQMKAKPAGPNSISKVSLIGVNSDDGTSITGRIEGGKLAIYCNAVSSAGPSKLVIWRPFDSDFGAVLAEGPDGPEPGKPRGRLALSQDHLYLPGSNAGQVFRATLGSPAIFSLAESSFRSALKLTAVDTAIAPGDALAIEVGGNHFASAVIEGPSPSAGIGDSATSAFYWLDRWIDVDAAANAQVYKTSLTGLDATYQADVTVGGNSRSQLLLASADPVPVMGSWLFVSVGEGAPLERVQVKTVSPTNPIEVEPSLSIAPVGQVKYRLSLPLPLPIKGKINPSLKFSSYNNGWDSNLLRSRQIYFSQQVPNSQQATAIAEDSANRFVALTTAWTTVAAGLFLVDPGVSGWSSGQAQIPSNPDLAWEYWNGTGWWRLKIDEDRTRNLQTSGTIKFTVPPDLKPVDWSGKTNHWIRARLIGGDYGRENVSVISEPGPGNNQTTQTVHRSTEGIQPPYALNVGAAYVVDQQAPQFLFTKDGGSLRDQSDANRSSGAEIEVFAPLSITLGRLDGIATNRTEAASDECLDDCECNFGTPSQSSDAAAADPAKPLETTAARSAQRALFLGLDSKLLGTPVTVLFAVAREQFYDGNAPLRVDALIGDRFVPLTATDQSRALGETGLVAMAFPVEPTKAELFGQTLAWLRLTPGGDADRWTPELSGVYLNAVWARAAETMTRELVGGSTGEPNLTLVLARPPLLLDTLELRVREPLGEEERTTLTQRNPAAVKRNVEALPGDWVLWKQVADTLDRRPTERVYMLDEATGTIRFGDGRHGMIPPTGPDAIVAFGYERASAGKDGGVPGNLIRSRSPLSLISSVETVETVRATDQSAGGVRAESAERVLEFGFARLRHRGRAVTAEDFESLVRGRSADVVQARCFVRSGRVRLVVVMRGKTPGPSRPQQRELARMLLEAAPPALAARGALVIEGPKVRRLRVELQLGVDTLDLAGAVGAAANARLARFFDSETGGKGGKGWPLGMVACAEDVAQALLDIPGLESIHSIQLYEVVSNGNVQPWPTSLRPGELAALDDDGVRTAFDVLETAQ